MASNDQSQNGGSSNSKSSKEEYMFGFKPDSFIVRAHSARTAAANCQYMLPTLREKVAANLKLKLLDVGCGPGSITLDLAGLVGSQGAVTGLDLSEQVLASARAAAKEQGVGNATFVHGEVYKLPFADGAFDVVHTHQAVAHFHRHVDAIRELARVTKKPGGVLCMREGILTARTFGASAPETVALLEEWIDVTVAAAEKGGIQADAGARLKGWTLAAGIPKERIRFSFGTWCYASDEERPSYAAGWAEIASSGQFYEKALGWGLASAERMAEMAEAWRRWGEDEEGVFGMMHGEVIAFL